MKARIKVRLVFVIRVNPKHTPRRTKQFILTSCHDTSNGLTLSFNLSTTWRPSRDSAVTINAHCELFCESTSSHETSPSSCTSSLHDTELFSVLLQILRFVFFIQNPQNDLSLIIGSAVTVTGVLGNLWSFVYLSWTNAGKLLGWKNKSDLIKEEGLSLKYLGCKVTCHRDMSDASFAEEDNDPLSKHTSRSLKLVLWRFCCVNSESGQYIYIEKDFQGNCLLFTLDDKLTLTLWRRLRLKQRSLQMTRFTVVTIKSVCEEKNYRSTDKTRRHLSFHKACKWNQIAVVLSCLSNVGVMCRNDVDSRDGDE